ncbi:MAG: LemA family protein [Coriobacteriales bacterium]|nr:LemA family protein [Coriobacteriales bacterium]
MVVIALVIVLVIGVVSCFGAYNSLVSKDEGVKAALSTVETDLQRRADLIPNLVETVKGAAAHETEVINAVTEARARMAGASTPSELAEADAALSSALSRLLLVVENYPDLKANANFRDLMTQLEGTENRIAVSRKDYNNAARDLNETIRRFPTNVIASIFGFTAADYFEAAEGAQEVPQVQF